MKYLHLLFIQLTSIVSLGLNVYLYTYVVELTKTIKDKTIADKILFEKLESKIALIPEKLLDDPVAAKIQLITQQDSALGHVFLSVSVVVLVGLVLCSFLSFESILGFLDSLGSHGPLYPGALKTVNIVPDKLVEVINMQGTAIRLEVITTEIGGVNTEVFLVSIKRANETVFKVVENIGSFLGEHPEISVKVAETISSALDAARGLF